MTLKFIQILALSVIAITAPAATLTVVVPNPPGGITDAFGRSIARYLTQALNRDVVVVNKGGADGRIAADYVISQAPSNPHVLVAASGTMLFPSVLSKVVVNDYTRFDHMVPMVRVPTMFAVSTALNVTTWDQFLRVARGRALNCAAGAASSEFFGQYVMKQFNIAQAQFVKFRGSGDMAPQLIAGNIDCAFDTQLVLLPLHRDQRVRVLAVASVNRQPDLSSMVMFSDLVPGLSFSSWAGISVAKNFVPEDRERLWAALRLAHRDSQHRATMTALGVEIIDEPTTQANWLHNEYQRYETMRQHIGLPRTD